MDNLLFKINPLVDEIITEKCPVPNWGNSLLSWLGSNLRKRYYALLDSFSLNLAFKNFISGVRAEYGIDDDVDLDKAYKFYCEAAKENESYALYKLYTIHRVESEKFKVKRDKNMEMLYLLKSMAYCESVVYFSNDTLYNVDTIYEIALHLDLEDQTYDKTNNLFQNLTAKGEYDDLDLRFTQAMAMIKFYNHEDDIINGISILHDLADNFGYPDAIYKLACFYGKPNDKQREKDPILAEKYFDICDNLNYYKCYNDFGMFLYQEKKLQKCQEILAKGVKLGNFRCFFLYYDIRLFSFDFLNEDPANLLQLIDLLIDDIITGNVFAFFEFFYMRRIMAKHFHVKENATHLAIQQDLFNVLLTLHQNKSFFDNNFQKGLVETEFLLSFGYINYIGIKDLLSINHATSENLLKSSFKLSTNQSYKRFCYTFIFKIRKRRIELKGKEGQKDEALLKQTEKTKMKLFKIYSESMSKGNLEDFSSSYFYFMAKLYQNGWGVKPDNITAYCYYYLSSKASLKYLGTGSIISYYRKYKASKVLKEETFVQIAEELEKYKANEMSKVGEDSLCYICYEYQQDVIIFPCRHMACSRCFNRFKDTNKCPGCRGKIIIWK